MYDEKQESVCEYCRGRKLLLTKKVERKCSIEVFVRGGKLKMNTFNHMTPWSEGISFEIKIEYCPKCGRKLNA